MWYVNLIWTGMKFITFGNLKSTLSTKLKKIPY